MADSLKVGDLPFPDSMFLVGSLLRFGSVIVWIVHIVACMGSSGCLGSHSKPELITSIDEPLKGPKLQGQKPSKPSVSEDFWTTSTCEMDNSAMHSRGSISSISTSNLTVDPHATSSGSIPSEFVLFRNGASYLMLNVLVVGLLLWNQTRQQWIGNKKPDNREQGLREPKLSWNSTYDSLLGSNKPFAQRIPLSVRNGRFSCRYLGAGRDVRLRKRKQETFYV
ncbi:unnamed protein product [Camellia sinensis]